jgi:hypothetical protein
MSNALIQDLLGDAAAKTAISEEQHTFDGDAEMTAMAEALNALGETEGTLSEQMNIVRLNRQAKMNNMANRQALLLARAKNDPLYAKYAKFNGIRLLLRAQIYKKYGSKAVVRARQLLAGVGGAGAAKK